MQWKNLTPHTIHIHDKEGSILTMQPHGPAARLAVEREDLGDFPGAGIPFVRSTMGLPTGLPPHEPGAIIIVSALVAEACPSRTDLAYPGEAIRDESGRIVGSKGLCAGKGLAAEIRRGAFVGELGEE